MSTALARVKRATKRRAASDEEWRAAIREAAQSGASLREIAKVAGVSNPRVHQILHS